MKVITRYGLLLVACVIFCLFVSLLWSMLTSEVESFINEADSYLDSSNVFSAFQPETEHFEEYEVSRCSMAKCFDLSRCLTQKEFKVYVYPPSNLSAISVVYSNILKVLKESSYYTNDYRTACLLVLAIDTIDRDRRSENFVKNVNELLRLLPSEMWNEGRNHIIFNLYHGTYPDYSDHDLGFDVGYAIIARASANAKVFRTNFDLSFPLFHKEHPLRNTLEREWSLKMEQLHLVSFKGKRYVYGIGSETRDSLYHLHNGDSSVMVTTCKHNTDWKKYEDQRCERDNVEYENWNYEEVMSNSTFCLTPRGRRLGSFRFLESLKLGCIPVVLSDDWVLPFSEIIDWTQAAVIAHEETVLTITDALNAIPLRRIFHMKQQARGLYQSYFSSVEKIVMTSIEIVKERINRQRGSVFRDWNKKMYGFSLPYMFTGYYDTGCSVILQATAKVSGRLNRHVKMLSDLSFVHRILVFWPRSRGIPPVNFTTPNGKVIDYIIVSSAGQNVMFSFAFSNYDLLVGDWLLFLDERVALSRKDAEAIYTVGKSEPARMTGMYSGVHKRVNGNWEADFASPTKRSILLPHLLFFRRL